jgi:hypothetical protein
MPEVRFAPKADIFTGHVRLRALERFRASRHLAVPAVSRLGGIDAIVCDKPQETSLGPVGGHVVQNNKRTLLRNIVAGLGLGAAAAASRISPASALEKSSPVSEPQDRWLDELGSRHRQVFDTISSDGVARALTFAHTFYAANRDGYGIEPGELGVVMILRAGSTAFGFNDNMWTKYGTPFAKRYKLLDPTTKSAPVVNIYNAADKAASLPTNGLTLDALGKLGGQFAICAVASRKLAEAVAQDTGGSGDAIFAEFRANIVQRARMVPAGIIAVNRAQEHNYALCYTA